jgi:hypothetical protein
MLAVGRARAGRRQTMALMWGLGAPVSNPALSNLCHLLGGIESCSLSCCLSLSSVAFVYLRYLSLSRCLFFFQFGFFIVVVVAVSDDYRVDSHLRQRHDALCAAGERLCFAFL